jgi:uncharacterized protein YutE (UPF0331/DUF86 family)
MTVSSEARERVVLERLRDRYEHQGYSFYTYPPRELLPTFLGQYRPDAVAMKDDGGVVIEIKDHMANKTRLSELARLFAGQSGWHLSIVTLDDSPGEELIRPYSEDRIEKALKEIEQLSRSGETRAAFILAWAAWEAAGRNLLGRKASESIGPIAPAQMAETLTQEGWLDEGSARRLWDLARIRNAIIHGDLDKDVDQHTVEFVNAVTRGLLQHVSQGL